MNISIYNVSNSAISPRFSHLVADRVVEEAWVMITAQLPGLFDVPSLTIIGMPGDNLVI